MKCLICGQDLETELSFTSLLLLKKEETYTCSACFNHFERISPVGRSILLPTRPPIWIKLDLVKSW